MGLRRVRATDGKVIIGRGSRDDKERIATKTNLLFFDKTISKEHAIITVETTDSGDDINKVTIVDAHSRHGVVVSGKVLCPGETVELKSDDWIGLVNTTSKDYADEVEEHQCKCVLDFYGNEGDELLFDVVRPTKDDVVDSATLATSDDLIEVQPTENDVDDDVEVMVAISDDQSKADSETTIVVDDDDDDDVPLPVVSPSIVTKKRLFSAVEEVEHEATSHSEGEDEDNEIPNHKRAKVQLLDKTHIVSGLIGAAVGVTVGAGLTFSTLLAVGRSLT